MSCTGKKKTIFRSTRLHLNRSELWSNIVQTNWTENRNQDQIFLALEQQSVEKEICVSLNDEETRIVFIDRKHGELSVGGK